MLASFRLSLGLALAILSSGCYQSHLLEGAPCETSDDCGVSPVGCAEATCVAGACRLVPVPDGCEVGETCDFTLGCVGGDAPTRDGGPFDGGIRDGGRDASFDTLGTDDATDVLIFVEAGLDSGLDAPFVFDGGVDAPIGFDGGRDAPIGFDGGRDAPIGFDGGRDAPIGFDGGRDAPIGFDGGRDAPIGFDGGRDAPIGFDGGFDGGRDAPIGFDGGRDAGRDAGSDAGSPPTSMARQCRPDTVITIADRPILSSTVTTLELWARVRGPGTIARKGESGGRSHYEITVQGTGAATTLRTSWSSGVASQFVEVPFGDRLGVYTHIALITRPVPGGSSLELWLDAMMVASAVLPAPVSDAFNNVALLLCSFDGDLDEVRLWNAAIDGALLASRRFGTVSPSTASLAAYWPLEGTGQILFDRTLNGSDGVAGDFSTPDPRDPPGISGGAF